MLSGANIQHALLAGKNGTQHEARRISYGHVDGKGLEGSAHLGMQLNERSESNRKRCGRSEKVGRLRRFQTVTPNANTLNLDIPFREKDSNTMKIAYSYGRFSTLEQAKGDSFRRQRDSAKQWCNDHDFKLSERQFFDKGKSGFYGENFKENGALKAFIQLHREGKIERDAVLIIDSVDRFSRLPVSKSAAYFLDVVNAGIGLAFSGAYDKRIITSELIDKEPYILQGIVSELNRAHAESAERSRKIKASKAAKKAQMQAGQIVAHNTVPKYFTFVPDNGIKERGAKGHYVHNEATPYIKELVDRFLAGESMYSIAADFNQRSIKTTRYQNPKTEWHRNTVRQILRNRVLIGEFIGVKNFVPPIIDEPTFLKVQNRLNENTRNRGQKGNFVNIFRGICFCATCGKAVNESSRITKGVAYRYLRCSNYGTRNACAKAYIRAEDMENDFFFNFLCKNPYRLINPDDVIEVSELKGTIAAKIARQNAIKSEIENWIKFASKGAFDEVEKHLTKLNNERERLKRDIDDLNAKAATIEDMPEELEALLKKELFHYYGEDDESGATEQAKSTAKVLRENHVIDFLKDSKAREKFRAILPTLLGKVTLDAKERTFAVFNRVGRKVYQSKPFPGFSNNTKRWFDSLTKWQHRKTASGQVIEVKRYQSKYYHYKHGKPKGEALAPK